MTNFEYYKEGILQLGDISEIAITKDGEIRKCYDLDCKECVLDGKGDCCLAIVEWLYEEHVEKPKPPKLSKKERAFCELIGTGYIARDNNKELVHYRATPHKHTNEWTDHTASFLMLNRFNSLKFDFIKWEDEEPWPVEELLKLEVQYE